MASGSTLGIGGAAAGRLIRQHALDVEPLNVAVYAAVAALFAVVAALACLAPSLRASRIDPLVAFRAD